MEKPKKRHNTTEQSPVPRNIMGSASASGNVSTMNPRSAPQSKILGGLCSSHTCLPATPSPNAEDIKMRIDMIVLIRRCRRVRADTKANRPININAYLWRMHIGQGANPSLCWRCSAKMMSPAHPRNSNNLRFRVLMFVRSSFWLIFWDRVLSFFNGCKDGVCCSSSNVISAGNWCLER